MTFTESIHFKEYLSQALNHSKRSTPHNHQLTVVRPQYHDTKLNKNPLN